MTQDIGNSLRIKNFLDENGSETLNALAPSKARMGSFFWSSALLSWQVINPYRIQKDTKYIYENLNNWMVWVGLSPFLIMILNLLHQTRLRGRWNRMGQKFRIEMWFCYLVPVLTGHEPSDSPPWHNWAPQCSFSTDTRVQGASGLAQPRKTDTRAKQLGFCTLLISAPHMAQWNWMH